MRPQFHTGIAFASTKTTTYNNGMKTLAFIRQISSSHPFWSKVKVLGDDECWLWTGSLDKYGYGYTGRQRCHRIAWEITKTKSLLKGDVVRHSCDTPACCNPSHLSTGTNAQNVVDRVVRQRSARGMVNGRAVLSNDDAMSIYREKGNRLELCKRYGVSMHTIVDIKNGRTWGWLTKHQLPRR